jgi:hypothetical protein
MIAVRFSAEDGNFSPRHHVHTGSGAHPAVNPVGTAGGGGEAFPEDKAAGA